MNVLLRSILLLSLGTAGTMAYAGSEYLWDNFDGFTSAENCQVQRVDTLAVQVAHAAVLLDQTGIPGIKTVEGELIKLQGGVKDLQYSGETYKAVRVLGVPNASDFSDNTKYAAKGDTGYLAVSAMSTLKNYEIMITHATQTKNQPSITAIGSSDTKLTGSIWRAATDNSQFVNYVCGGRTYSVFNVFAKESDSAPVARVGVATDNTTIFNFIDTSKITDQNPPAATPVVASDIPLPRPRPSSAPQPVATGWTPATATAPALPPEQNYAGQTCNRSDTDPVKCMVCVIHGEAILSQKNSMIGVGRNVMERYKNSYYPHSICKIVYQTSPVIQYTGLVSGMRITSDRKTAGNIEEAAREAIHDGGNGFLGYRSCSYSTRGVDIGGNCYRKNAWLEDLLNGVPVDVTDQIATDQQLQDTLINPEG